MYRVYQALIASVPMVFSTATFPGRLQAEFEDNMALGLIRPIPMVRAALNPSNIAYHVISLPNTGLGDELKPLQEFLVKVENQVTSPSGMKPHVIIFMRSRAKIDEMITKLQGLGLGDQFAHFHAKVPEVEKQAELDRFLGGKARILLATTALGAGFDFSHVDVVIHWRGSYSFCDFMQESGRTERSTGRPGWSFCAVTDYDRQPRDSNSVEEVEFKKYLNECICRRAAISRYFNGFDQSCEPGMTSCDLCIIKQNQASRVQQAVRQRQQESARQIEWFAEAVRFWQERGCLRCFYHYWISKHFLF
jgi:superfamily II DNA helicase RecQ